VAKRLGIIPDRYAQPLFNLLRIENKFILQEKNPAELAIKLRHKELDGAFLSPIDFAKDYSMYRIISQVAAVSQKESGTVLLAFREDTRNIKSIGANPAYGSEIVLASLVLAEKFEIQPQIIPASTGIECLGKSADACLICGDEAVKFRGHSNKIDLVDEWYDITELPYVHGFWVTREEIFDKTEIDFIIKCGLTGAAQSDKSAKAGDTDISLLFSYSLGDVEIQSINEFLRMAYYHGIIWDIPEVRFI
jgi:predicted solute-binding protein